MDDALACSCIASVVMRPTTWTPTYCTLFLVLSRHIWTSFKLDYARLLGVLILLFLVLALTWLTWWVME